jgi:membrane associated rhomboid family serine protease
VSTPPPDSPAAVLDESAETYCYNHPKTATRLRCSRCDRPICGRCAIPASVGQHCPECVAEARKAAPKVRSVNVSGAPATYAFLAVNVIVFVFQLASQGANGGDQVLARGILAPLQIANGEWYRLITPMFLHLNTVHIAVNSMSLFFVGPNVEQAFGTRRFVLIYLVSGFIGNVASYALGSCLIPSAGASGAIFGILGALAVYTYRRRSNAMMNAFFRNILFWLGLNVVITLSVPQINVWAHFGGLAGGAILAAGYDAGVKMRPLNIELAVTLAIVGAGVLLTVVRTSALLNGACGLPGNIPGF